MEKDLKIEDQEGNEVIIFKDIRHEYDKVIRRVVYRLMVNFDIFKADAILEAEEYDFLTMKSDLKSMYENKLKTFFFSPIGEQVSIKFELSEMGQIRISLNLNNAMFTGKMEVVFSSDLSQIPHLINDLDLII